MFALQTKVNQQMINLEIQICKKIIMDNIGI